MTVAQLCKSDIKGGAARAAYRLHRGLREEGTESMMYVRNKRSTDDTVRAIRLSDGLGSRLRRLWRYGRIQSDFALYRLLRPDHLELFSDDRTLFQGEIIGELPAADVLNLHWIAKFVDISTFFSQTTVPIVWTLHDMNAFTGGCHYDVGCGSYESTCGQCPQLGSRREHDLARAVWDRKHAAYETAIRRGRLHIVTPSKWLAREARRSKLLGRAPIQVIPYGLDHTVFCPRDTENLRLELGIPESRDVILFVAHTTTNHRKGFDLLINAFDKVDIEDVTLVSVGSNEPPIPESLSHVHAGRIEDDIKLAQFYSMASLFVIPSRQDNLPNTVLEAMACGTPVVGTDAGGIPDMVRPDETGWLAETGNVRSLRSAIEAALTDHAEREWKARRCREVVEEEYTLKRQADQYKKLYKSILKN